MNRPWRNITAIALLLTAATSCATRVETASPAPPLETATVPADRIADDVFGAQLLADLEYAQQDLRDRCMADRGHPELARIGAVNQGATFASLNVRAPAYATLDEKALRTKGFGSDEPAKRAHLLSYQAAYDNDLDQCEAAASAEIGKDFPQVRSDVYQLMNDVTIETGKAVREGANGVQFRSLISPLLDCLDHKGLTPPGSKRSERDLESYGLGLPQGRLLGTDPAQPKRVKGTIEILPAQPARKYQPTPAEVHLAVESGRCSRQLGFADEFVEHRLSVVRQVLRRHEPKLAEIHQKLSDLHDKNADHFKAS